MGKMQIDVGVSLLDSGDGGAICGTSTKYICTIDNCSMDNMREINKAARKAIVVHVQKYGLKDFEEVDVLNEAAKRFEEVL